MAGSIKTSITLNIRQNHPDFELENIEDAPLIFKEKLFSKELNPPKENPEKLENFRSVTIKCLYKGCSKRWLNQRVNQSTSNYIIHYRNAHKAFNINRLLYNLNNDNNGDDSSLVDVTQASTSTNRDIFAKQRATKRPKTPEEVFNKEKFNKLLLNFIISNNISFRSISSISFKELLLYLNKRLDGYKSRRLFKNYYI
ncbi:hypothetical protein BKA65DRAFT_531945 [Rhexocercosporidium sp. MPI-PUGE-AT-0058]|nr:hypothetical protein BKA65DRAFT_531945 [Rhexocercosporidium sp. MPI-PUGE-AT-0058]